MVRSPTPSSGQKLTAKRTTKRMVVSRLQHGWLNAMGVDVPWIVAQSPVGQSAEPAAPTSTATSATPAKSNATPPLPPRAPKRAPAVFAPASSAVTAEQSPESSLKRLNLADLTLAELAQTIQSCQRCGLCQARQQAVPGEGVDKPAILIVGEAPGEQEDMQGKPFVGRSGQLLQNMMSAIGHGRDTSVFITNVVKCRPPANRNPRDDEIAACAPYLARQIELLAPQAILAMGRFAAHALLKTEAPLQQLRADTHSIDVAGVARPVVVTYHPAYLLRRPVDKRLAWEDLKRLRALVSV
ncbi:MAG TPA: uracil-DNA glycosylase family protein [Orrella sp.]